MVSTGHHLASLAAVRILEKGGNAADAGVAAGLCLNVVQPDLTQIGGVAPIMFYDAVRKSASTVAGLGGWPKNVDLDWLRSQGRIPTGIRRSVVPSAMGAWLTALERFGTISVAEAFEPAIELAENGFRVHSLLHSMLSDPATLEGLRRWSSLGRTFMRDDKPLAIGESLVQPELAKTLKKLVEASSGASSREEGIARAYDRFYRGDIARAMVEFSDSEGGWLAMEDLDAFSAEVEPAYAITYRGATVYSCGPWCQGPVVLQALNILEGYDIAAMELGGVDYYHIIVEALKAAFADRDRYYGDPRFVDVPMQGLLSKDYAAAWRARIDLGTASPGMPVPGDAWAFQGESHANEFQMPKAGDGPFEPDTSYLCVVDSDGNAFSATPSDGARETPIVPDLGFIISSRGVQSWLDPDHPAAIAPGKRPRLTPNPGIVVKDGEFVMPYGTPGADVQPQAMIQFLTGFLDHRLDIQEAIETPRVATYSFPSTHDPHLYRPGLVKIEGRARADVMSGLIGRGHKIEPWPDWFGTAGSIGAVMRTHDGAVMGGADPRRVAYALGW
ncbi:gamma-glutamyltransferase family protein [Pelagibacterium sp. H642]|uniref:gamma-glutamyltransferase family protein n=1 Tax=Pelagibacterium sp. H642 TaxID=1881069 RepID=UPI0028159B4D|nr:gamma-glutamyltransferase family protein [Pelagibacterium sp. H642]WMT89374.1 gamma-glutamyltransferase family protein [Pelagibacterium sp. H642]